MTDLIKLAYAYGSLKAKTAELSNDQLTNAGLALGGTAVLGGGLMYANHLKNKEKEDKAIRQLIAAKELKQNAVTGLFGTAGALSGVARGKGALGRVGLGLAGGLLGTGLTQGALGTLPILYGAENLDALNRRDAERTLEDLHSEEIDLLAEKPEGLGGAVQAQLIARRRYNR